MFWYQINNRYCVAQPFANIAFFERKYRTNNVDILLILHIETFSH